MRAINFIFILLFTLATQAQKTDLSLHLEEGKTYLQATNTIATIDQEFNGQKMNVRVTVGGTMSFFVKKATSTNYILDTEFKSLTMEMQLPQGNMEFSSEKIDENDPFSKILSAIKNKPFEVIMDRSGKITDVKDIEYFWAEAIDQFDEIPAAQREQIKAQIMKSYGEDALKGTIEMVTAIYPDHAVNKGDTWTVHTNLESGMSANMTTNYEFIEVTDQYALIKGNSTIKTNDKDAYIETNGMPMKYDMTGTMSSVIKVDAATGWIIESTIDQIITGNAYIKENAQIPDGMKIPLKMRNEMIITNQ